MLARLQQLCLGDQMAARGDGPHVTQHEIPVDKLVKRRLLTWVLAVPQALAHAVHHPRYLLVNHG